MTERCSHPGCGARAHVGFLQADGTWLRCCAAHEPEAKHAHLEPVCRRARP